MRKIMPVHRKKRSFQKIFWKEETLCREKEKKLLGSKNGSFLEGSSLKENFESLLCMQKTRSFCEKLPKKGKSSKASWTSPDPCRWYSLLRCGVTFFLGWWLLPSSFGSHGLFYFGRRFRSRQWIWFRPRNPNYLHILTNYSPLDQSHTHNPSTPSTWYLLQTYSNDNLIWYKSSSNNPSSQNFT